MTCTCVIPCSDLTAEEREWERVKKEREQKNAEQERARHELETRRRIESRLKAKQEADAKSRGMCVYVSVSGVLLLEEFICMPG